MFLIRHMVLIKHMFLIKKGACIGAKLPEGQLSMPFIDGPHHFNQDSM